MEETKNLEKDTQIEEDSIQDLEKTAKWYILKTKPGKETMVEKALIAKMNNKIIAKSLFDVKIIEEEYYVEKKDKKTGKVKKELAVRNSYPNHIYVKMIYSKEIWWEIVSTEGAYSFLGPNAWPQPLRKSEIKTLGLDQEKVQIDDIQVGDKIKINNGIFKGYETIVEAINKETNSISACVYLLNQGQKIDISIDDIVKL